MRIVIEVLQNLLIWIKIAQGTVQAMPVGGAWKDDFMRLAELIVNEITLFLQTHRPEPSAEPTPARGFAATAKFCDSVLARLDLLVASTGAPKAERLAQAVELSDSLSDPKLVYQAKKGDDANALTGAKAAAGRRIELIKGQ